MIGLILFIPLSLVPSFPIYYGSLFVGDLYVEVFGLILKTLVFLLHLFLILSFLTPLLSVLQLHEQ